MGLREHDVVVQMNGAAIDGEDQIRKLLHELAPGRSISLVISREGQQMTVTTQMADRGEVERQAWELHLAAPVAGPQALPTGLPSEDPAFTSSQNGSLVSQPVSKYSKGFLGTILLTPAYTGVMLQRIGPQLASYFGVPKGTGLLVTGIANNSPAQMAGIRAGDVVLRANAKTIVGTGDWAKVVRDAKGRPIAVTLLRDKQEKTVSLTPDAKKHS
jgi:serine protease Do